MSSMIGRPRRLRIHKSTWMAHHIYYGKCNRFRLRQFIRRMTSIAMTGRWYTKRSIAKQYEAVL